MAPLPVQPAWPVWLLLQRPAGPAGWLVAAAVPLLAAPCVALLVPCAAASMQCFLLPGQTSCCALPAACLKVAALLAAGCCFAAACASPLPPAYCMPGSAWPIGQPAKPFSLVACCPTGLAGLSLPSQLGCFEPVKTGLAGLGNG